MLGVRREDKMNRWMIILLALAVSNTAFGQTNAPTLEQRMKNIMIPTIEFRQANPIDVLHFLVEATSASEPDPNRPVPCIGRVITNQSVLADSYTFELEDGSDLELPALTLEYHRISLFEALHRVTEELGLIFRLQDDKIEFFTKDGKRIVRKQIVEPER
jgi:hypothetical protein